MFKKLVLAGFFAGVAISSAQAGDFYVKAIGGATMESKQSWGGSDYSMDTGYNLGGALGYFVTPNISIEGEGLYTSSGYKGYNSELNSTSVLANVVYHFDRVGDVEFYVGLGLGAIDLQYKGYGNDWSEWVFGGQALAGASVPVNDKLSLFAEYRYQDAQDASGGGGTDYGYDSHNLSVGFNYRF